MSVIICTTAPIFWAASAKLLDLGVGGQRPESAAWPAIWRERDICEPISAIEAASSSVAAATELTLSEADFGCAADMGRFGGRLFRDARHGVGRVFHFGDGADHGLQPFRSPDRSKSWQSFSMLVARFSRRSRSSACCRPKRLRLDGILLEDIKGASPSRPPSSRRSRAGDVDLGLAIREARHGAAHLRRAASRSTARSGAGRGQQDQGGNRGDDAGQPQLAAIGAAQPWRRCSAAVRRGLSVSAVICRAIVSESFRNGASKSLAL